MNKLSGAIHRFVSDVFGLEHKAMATLAVGSRELKLSKPGFGADQNILDNQKPSEDRLQRYADSEDMDNYPDTAGALDIYADDSTQTDSETRKTLWVESKDERIRDELNEMYTKKVNVDQKAWGISRSLCKYGDDFEEIIVNDQGVQGLGYLPPAMMHRVEGSKGELLGFVQSANPGIKIEAKDKKFIVPGGGFAAGNQKHAIFDSWRVVHMRLQSKYRESKYGWSVLDPARWVFKRLVWLEDAAMLYRLSRSPSRYAFYIDVTGLSNLEAHQAIQQYRNELKKRKFVNPKTGKMDMSSNPLTMDEDFFFGVKNGQENTRVDILNGPAYQQMDDVAYFQDKLYAGMKVPKAYLSHDENMPSRATLSAEDIRFAMSVLRIQKEEINGYHQIGRVHLACRKIDPANVDFTVRMTVPSAIFELGQMEVRRARAELASMMGEHVSLQYILSNIYGMSDEEAATIMKQKGVENKALAAATAESHVNSFPKIITEQEIRKMNTASESKIQDFILKEMEKQNSAFGKKMTEIGMLLRDITHLNTTTRHAA